MKLFYEGNITEIAKVGQIWIGLKKVRGDWQWSDHTLTNYFSWHKGQPDGCCGANVHCVTMNSLWTRKNWSDADCNSSSGFICKYNPTSKLSGLLLKFWYTVPP